MRDFSKPQSARQRTKWVMLDGDIDAEWIESMNTVMDDNKVLTLVSNERIPLTDSMRLLFEISHLRNASPATVSRAGVLYLNEADVGWRPYVQTWVETRCTHRPEGDRRPRAVGETFVPPTLDQIRVNKMEARHAADRLLDGDDVLLAPRGAAHGGQLPAGLGEGDLRGVLPVRGHLGGRRRLRRRQGRSTTARPSPTGSAARGQDSQAPRRGPSTPCSTTTSTATTGEGRALEATRSARSYTVGADGHEPFSSIVVPTMDTTRLSFASA